MRRSRTIQRWHWGKLLMLWAWGGGIAALLLTSFLSRTAESAPTASLFSLLGTLVILAALTAVTWVWLGGRDAPPTEDPHP